MAATSTIIDLLDSGDHIVACDDLYGGTYRLFENVKKRSSGIKTDFIDFSDLNKIENAITDKTKMIWVETPTNPLLKVIDLDSISELTKGRDIITVCDNTFCSPWVQKPLNHNFDIVMHSATKYIGGHSDVVAGIAVISKERSDLSERLDYLLNASGAITGPFDSFLLLRSLKTLSVRMERHCENAMLVADYLQKNFDNYEIIYPGLKSHKNHDIAKKQMNMFGGMVSVLTDGNIEKVKKILNKFEVFTLAESLGGVESLVSHPATMTHASIPKEKREALGVKDGLIRLSIGLETIDDILSDLNNALS